MKKILLIVLLLNFVIAGYSQQSFGKKIIQVIPQQNFFLNGGVRSVFGGKSRVYFEIKLPPRTIEWYYVLTTYPSENKTNLDLVPQLTKLFATGVTSAFASAILTPTGSYTCDVYLTDIQNANAFIEKVDRNGGKFYHVISANRENFRNGAVQIKDIKEGTWYLCVRNPSETQGIAISLEVAVIVEDEAISNQQNKAIGYGNLGWGAFEEGDLDRCIDLSKRHWL